MIKWMHRILYVRMTYILQLDGAGGLAWVVVHSTRAAAAKMQNFYPRRIAFDCFQSPLYFVFLDPICDNKKYKTKQKLQ